MRSKLHNSTAVTSVGGKKAHTEGDNVINTEAGKLSLKMQGLLDNIGSDSSDCTDEDDINLKTKQDSLYQRSSLRHINDGLY